MSEKDFSDRYVDAVRGEDAQPEPQGQQEKVYYTRFNELKKRFDQYRIEQDEQKRILVNEITNLKKDYNDLYSKLIEANKINDALKEAIVQQAISNAKRG